MGILPEFNKECRVLLGIRSRFYFQYFLQELSLDFFRVNSFVRYHITQKLLAAVFYEFLHSLQVKNIIQNFSKEISPISSSFFQIFLWKFFQKFLSQEQAFKISRNSQIVSGKSPDKNLMGVAVGKQ